ncbi:unnamed protein product [Trichogramma brassicae]|uniref:Uncharacterized protein n=1 Tax=Trichogramma brassicae TaxID=86971 RepID=A0A6H5IAF6_9HYME|nr:unnamed protein product [Trichogramma brassicae]
MCYTRAGRSLSDAGFRPSAIFIQARVFCRDSTPRQLERVITQQNEAPNVYVILHQLRIISNPVLRCNSHETWFTCTCIKGGKMTRYFFNCRFLLQCVYLTAHTTRMSNFFMYRIVVFVETSPARVILSACFTRVSCTIMHRIDFDSDVRDSKACIVMETELRRPSVSIILHATLAGIPSRRSIPHLLSTLCCCCCCGGGGKASNSEIRSPLWSYKTTKVQFQLRFDHFRRKLSYGDV